MRFQRFKWLLIVTFLQFAGLWAATQLVEPATAEWEDPVCTLYGHPVYAPWKLLEWQMRPARPARVERAMGLFVLYAAALLGIYVLLCRGALPRVRAFGAQGWGTWREMKKAGLLGAQGTVVGIERGCLLTYGGPEHQLVSGASRSGKGVGHVVPTLLCWPHSALVYDVKGELWELTAGIRSRSQHCLLFNPVHPDSARFNPLLEVRKGAHEIRDVQNIVEMLVNPDGSKPSLNVWDQQAGQFLVALILHVLHTEPPEHKHLGRVRDLLLEFDDTCRAMMTTPHWIDPHTGRAAVYPEIGRVARSLLGQAERFRSSVRGTAEGYLTLWADPVVQEVTRRSDFTLGDLVCLEKPVTLYLQPPPSDAYRVRPLIRLLLNQAARALMERRHHDARGRAKQHTLLMLLDEFPTLGKLEFLVDNLRQMAGYGIKAHLIVQSFNDVIERYGPSNSVIDNCHVLVCFASADTATQNRISQMAGEVVEYRESYSEPGAALAAGRRSVSRSEHVRPLLPPGQVRMFPQDQQLIFVTGFKPFRTPKLRYYQNPELTRRLLPPPPRSAVLHPKGTCSNDWDGERPKGALLPLPEELGGTREKDESGSTDAALPMTKGGLLDA